MNGTQTQTKPSLAKQFKKLLAELTLFFMLLVLPAFTIWVACGALQQKELEISRQKSLDEMSEITAHMLRMANPSNYYQEAIQRLCDAFKWAENLDDVNRISTNDKLELFLFDSEGKRLNWPPNENSKKKVSEDYVKLLKNISQDSDYVFTKAEQRAAGSFSGNVMTARQLVATPNTLVNFQGIGLTRMGGWFETSIPTKDGKLENGSLIAWLHTEKLNKYTLADQAINKLQKLTNSDYTFSWIDLNDISKFRCSRNRKFKEPIKKLLSEGTLKSSFMLYEELFSINDTPDGIRLICSKPSPEPRPIQEKYNRLLWIIIPVLLLLFSWTKLFRIHLNFSVKFQSIMIFGFAAFTGIAAMAISTVAYQYEKEASLTQQYQQNAIETLEKVDQQFLDSYKDLLVQYRLFIKQMAGGNSQSPSQILNPLIKATEDGIISFSSYNDKYGNVLFQTPSADKLTKTGSFADKYSKVLNRVATQCLHTYNSSRSVMRKSSDQATLTAVTNKAVESLLHNRSAFQEIILDNDNGMAFMDLNIDNTNLASGCLLIIHEIQNMETRYLKEMGENLSSTTGFELIAFPKKQSKQSAYYPKYSYLKEEPLWKLNDMLNQTQVSSFKAGYVNNEKVMVAALPAHNLKNYNLFLSMPISKIKNEAFSLSSLFVLATILALLFIVILSLILINTITSPVEILTSNAEALRSDNTGSISQIAFSDARELESISTGLTNMVAKVREFEDYKSLTKLFQNKIGLNNDNFESDYLYSSNSVDGQSLCYISSPDKNTLFMVLMKDCNKGVRASTELAMAGMTMKVQTEENGIKSPFTCIKGLEEYFRINLRKKLDCSIVAISMNIQTGQIKYSGFGLINLLKYNASQHNYETYSLPHGEAYWKEFTASKDLTCELNTNDSLIAITEPFSIVELERLGHSLESSENSTVSYRNKLQNIVSELTKSDHDISTVAYITRKPAKERAVS